MRIPFLRPYLADVDDVITAIRPSIQSGWLTKGPVLAAYESALAERLQVGNVVATSSGTVGLAYTYKALGMTGKVLVPSFTFLASVTALTWAGGEPVFVDVRRSDFTIDPAAVEAAMSDEITGIIAVPVFGAPCANDALASIAAAAGIPLVYDSAHGVGSSFRGRPLGSFGSAEVFSTTPTKTLVTGEGGFVATDDDELAATLRVMVEYGNNGSYETTVPGLNGRLSEIHAGLGVENLKVLDAALGRRAELVAGYHELLAPIPGIGFQQVADDCVSSFKDFTITIDEDAFGASRDQLAKALIADGIDCRMYFVPPVHEHAAYVDAERAGSLSVTGDLARSVLSIPLWTAMTESDLREVAASIARAGG